MATPPIDSTTPALLLEPAPRSARRRRLLAGIGAIALAVPVSVALAGSGQAAPTLTIAQAQAQIAALQTKEDAADEAFDEGTIAASQAAAQARSAQAAVTTQSLKLDGMEAHIASFAAATYTTGGLNPVDSLLAGGDPETMLTKAASMNEIARNENAQLLAISAQREVLTGAQQTATDKAQAASASLKQLSAARAQITNVIAQENAVLSHLQAQARAQLLAQQAAAEAASRAEAREALARAVTVAPTAPASASAPSGATVPVPNASGAAQIALKAAYSQMGKPYQYGGAGPDAYDCSGLVMWSFAHAGISLPHSAEGQYGYGTHVSRSELEPGDLVFYNDGDGEAIGHVGIYVGNGEMIDANHTGGWVGVRPLYSGYVGATRL